MRSLVAIAFICFAGNLFSQQTRQYFVESKMNGLVDFTTPRGPVRDLPFWGFGSSSLEEETIITLPGPHIEAVEGDSIHVYLFNPSEEGHTIHFHGLDVDQANDGVPATSRFVLHREAFWYRFKASHAGNYLYHCHVTTTMHLILGMYGMVTVYAADSTKHAYTNYGSYTKAYNYLAAELDSRWNRDYTSIGSFLNFNPDIFTINGKAYTDIYSDSSLAIYADSADTVLLRLRNIGYGPQEYIFPKHLSAEVLGSDGRKIEPSVFRDTLLLYPGERYNVRLFFNNDDSSAVQVNFLNSIGLELLGTEYLPINANVFNPPPQTASLEEEKQSSTDWKLYPNPSAGMVRIDFQDQKEPAMLQVFDARGSLVKVLPLEKEIDLSELPNGLYWLRIGASEAKRFVMSK